MLPNTRVHEIGETAYAHEREAIHFARNNIPNRDPFHMWSLFDLVDPSTGRLHEIDLLVLGFSALYLIEIKSGPGIYSGDSTDWYRTPPDTDRSRYMDPPLKLANLKAKIFKSRLQSKMKQPKLAPRVEALVFLSHPDTTLKLASDGRLGVILRDDLARAVTHHDFPGAPPNWHGRPINSPAAADIAQAIRAIGVRPRVGRMHVGSYELGQLLQEGPGYQDRAAKHRQNERISARARTYLVPAQTSVERRQQLLRAADREASLLYDVREHRNILTYSDYVTDAPLGPTVLLETFTDSQPLGAFLRLHPELPFEDRVEIILQVGRALTHCHHKEVVHGAINPEAILVRRNPEQGLNNDLSPLSPQSTIETRLFSFQFGSGSSVESTHHRTALSTEPNSIYQAPELRAGTGSTTAASDIYGLGAIAYLVFTGRAPADSPQEIDARLSKNGHLDPAVITDAVPECIAEWIRCTTAAAPINRSTELSSWLELLEGEVRKLASDPSKDVVHPLQAVKEDTLEDGFLVEGVLGHGATARVLKVIHDDYKNSIALKISFDESQDDRLRREGKQLATLRHQHIVPYYDTRTLGGRTCLLLGLAGETTLDKHLASEGTVSLEYGSRFGEDLLSALEELEEKGVLHRDIKPANVGVRAVGKSAHHLTLFDFSLAGVAVTDTRVGTAVYREPYLGQRGAWDHAADRWSAAITLHEMLTAVRPAFPDNANPADPTTHVQLTPERFDAGAREALTAFFERALHPDVEQRFANANAMRQAWLRSFDSSDSSASPDNSDTDAPTPANRAQRPPGMAPAVSDAALARISPDTLIGELPLGPRAINALGRAGLTIARDLLGLPDNRLSLIRGIGTRVAKEILSFRRRWQAAAQLSAEHGEAFYPGYLGPAQPLNQLTQLAQLDQVEQPALPARTISLLTDAGIRDLKALAEEPKGPLSKLLKPHKIPLGPLKALLAAQHRAAATLENPSTLEAWVARFFAGQKKTQTHLRALWGLDGPFSGQLDVTAQAVAEHFGLKAPASVYISHRKCRDAWAELPALANLRELCGAVLASGSGAMRQDEAGRALLGQLAHSPHDPLHGDGGLAIAQAIALLRVVADVEQDQAAGNKFQQPALSFVRLKAGEQRVPWFLIDPAEQPTLERLGRRADSFASRDVIAAPSEVGRALVAEVENTRLATVSPHRLAGLAALASSHAARSTALELYPRDMHARRALELSATVIIGNLSADDIQRRVAGRYPAAQPLPARPLLDDLLKPLGLIWNGELYGRKPSGAASSVHTAFNTTANGQHTTRKPLDSAAGAATGIGAGTGVEAVGNARQLALHERARPEVMASPEADVVDARDFDDGLREALDRQQLRVLAVSANRASDAALALAHRLNTTPVMLDQRIVATMQQLMLEDDEDTSALFEIDREGPASGEDWYELRELAAEAAAKVAEELLPPTGPLLLCQPGLIARFELLEFVRALASAAEKPQSEAILLLVPVTGQPSGLPAINGYAIPHINPWQRMWVPPPWIRKHKPAIESAAESSPSPHTPPGQ